MERTKFGNGEGLKALRPINITHGGFWEMLQMMRHTAFGGRQLGEAASIYAESMLPDSCFVVATLSGAMTVAKQSFVLCEMIEQGMVNCIISTGALMAHGLIEAAGMQHFVYDDSMDDRALFEAGYNRVYDTLEPERNLDEVEELFHKVLHATPSGTAVCSRSLCFRLGQWLNENTTMDERGILKSAYRHKVPVFIPAFTDSELGLDFALYNRRRPSVSIKYDPFSDVESYTRLIIDAVQGGKDLGIFTIGGGVPRNWAQQVGPYVDTIARRNYATPQEVDHSIPLARFKYGIRICPEPVHWGGLSGCTYSEGTSWGKFVPPSEGGRYAEVPCDATIAWPILVRAVLDSPAAE